MAELNPDQAVAYKAMLNWFKNDTESKQLFVVCGNAGSGKSFLINYFLATHPTLTQEDVAFCSPTAKAAFRISETNGYKASTIHRLIYVPVFIECQEMVNGTLRNTKRLTFRQRAPEEIRSLYKLIICDEFSMVEATLLEHLLSFGVPVLAVGDDAQLPPVGKPHGLLSTPDAKLNTVMRQSKDSPILYIADRIRNGFYVPTGKYGDDVVIASKHMCTDSFINKALMSYDQVLCGYNATRTALNDRVRALKDIDVYTNTLPLVGEKVICTQNNYECVICEQYSLANGMIGYVKKIREIGEDVANISFALDFRPNEDNENITIDTGIFTDSNWAFEPMSEVYINSFGVAVKNKKDVAKVPEHLTGKERQAYLMYLVRNKDDVDIQKVNRFEFGYAITVHKSQGSEWDRVVVVEEPFGSKADRAKWLYTAVTRAKKKLIILR